MNFKEKKRRDIGIDITPVVDTVFNLLIFFALSLRFTSPASLDITLPPLTSYAPSPEPAAFVLQVNHTGELRCNQEVITLHEFEQRLKEELKNKNNASAIISADERVPHGVVIRIMDACKKYGVKKISIAAEITDQNN